MNLIESPDHSQRGHHPLGPSGTNYRDPRIGGCLGFVNQDSSDNTAAEEGTANHETMDAATREWVRAGCEGSITDYFHGEHDDFTQANLHYVASKIEHVVMSAQEVHPELMVELRDDRGKEINFGHLDLLCIDGVSATLDDYKFGWIPVKPAVFNRQGWNYAAAVFQMFPDLLEINVRFIQPKRNWTTEHTFFRGEDADRLRFEIQELNRQSLEVRESRDPEKLNPGAACEFCALKSTCSGFLKNFDVGRLRTGLLPECPPWSAESVETPEDAAAAKAWIDVFEQVTPSVKSKCAEIAGTHGEIRNGDWAWAPTTGRTKGKIPSVEELLRGVEEYFGVTQEMLLPKMSIGKEDVVKTAVNHLKATTRPGDTKKALTEEVSTTLKVTGLYEEGEEYTKLKKVRTTK